MFGLIRIDSVREIVLLVLIEIEKSRNVEESKSQRVDESKRRKVVE